MKVFAVKGESIVAVTEAEFPEAAGEIRDLAILPLVDGRRGFATVTADEEKPERKARLQVWSVEGKAVRSRFDRSVSLGEETRARQIVPWPEANKLRLLSVGFVTRGDQILGQLLDWGEPPAGTDGAAGDRSR